MKKIRDIIKDKTFYICIIIAGIFFGIFSELEYTTDTYTVFENTAKETIQHFFASGRFITGICQVAVRGLHLTPNITYAISYSIAMICLTISLYKLYNIFSKEIKSLWIGMLATVLVVINVFSIELFLYIEKGIMLFSVLLNILAFEKLIQYLKGNKKSLVFVFGYMLIANFSYQGTVALFVALSLVYIIAYSKNVKEFIKNNIVTALLYGIPALINYLIVKFVFANSRIAGEFDLALSIQKILEGTKKMLFTYSILPKYLFLIMIMILLIAIFYFIIKQDKGWRKRVVSILSVLYIIVGTLLTTILPQFMQATSSIWFVPRSSYAFGGICGILIVYLFMNYKVNIKIERILILAIIAFLLVQYTNFQIIAKDHYTVNYMDKYYAMQVQNMINEYEKKTGKSVNKIAFYQSETANWTYPEIKEIGDANIRAIYPDWSRIPYLRHYLKRNFEEVEKSEEIYNTYFKDKNWKYFNSEQLVIQNDTLHLYVY